MKNLAPTFDLQADLAAARAGVSDAQGRVLQRCRPYLLTVANAELDSGLRVKEGASDLVQKSVDEAQRALGKFKGTSEQDLRRWLKGILKNNILDAARRYTEAEARDIRLEIPLDREQAKPLREQLTAGGGTPLQGLVALEKAVALKAGLARLSDEDRRIIDLRHTQELTFPQIGEALGKSAEAARKVWFRALGRLRQELKKHDEFGSSS